MEREKIKILLVEDQMGYAEILVEALQKRRFKNVIIELNAKNAINYLEKCSVDIVLMDINMPDFDGLEATEYLTEHFPGIKVLILSNYDREAYLQEAIKLGVKGYLLKNEHPDEIAKAIDTVVDGGKFYSKSIYGDTMVYDWIERDTGNSIEVSVNISTEINGTTVNATAKRTITDEDDILGSSAVEYCDAANGDGYLYNTGYVSFYVRQR